MKTLFLTLFSLTMVLGITSTTHANCLNAVKSITQTHTDSFHRIKTDDWVSLIFFDNKEFTGKFKYILEDSVVFIGTDYKTYEFKTDHVLKAKLQIFYNE